MAKVQKKWVNLDENTWWLVATDVKIEDWNTVNIKDYIDSVATWWVKVHTDTVDPTVDDDIDNYNVWDVWINTDTNETFRVLDNTDWAAVWVQTSLTTDELSIEALLTEIREILTIDATDEANWYKDLVNIPYNAEIEVTPIWWPEQEIWTDFDLVTDGTDMKRLSWSWLWIDWIIADWDKVQVEYKYL